MTSFVEILQYPFILLLLFSNTTLWFGQLRVHFLALLSGNGKARYSIHTAWHQRHAVSIYLPCDLRQLTPLYAQVLICERQIIISLIDRVLWILNEKNVYEALVHWVSLSNASFVWSTLNGVSLFLPHSPGMPLWNLPYLLAFSSKSTFILWKRPTRSINCKQSPNSHVHSIWRWELGG